MIQNFYENSNAFKKSNNESNFEEKSSLSEYYDSIPIISLDEPMKDEGNEDEHRVIGVANNPTPSPIFLNMCSPGFEKEPYCNMHRFNNLEERVTMIDNCKESHILVNNQGRENGIPENFSKNFNYSKGVPFHGKSYNKIMTSGINTFSSISDKKFLIPEIINQPQDFHLKNKTMSVNSHNRNRIIPLKKRDNDFLGSDKEKIDFGHQFDCQTNNFENNDHTSPLKSKDYYPNFEGFTQMFPSIPQKKSENGKQEYQNGNNSHALFNQDFNPNLFLNIADCKENSDQSSSQFPESNPFESRLYYNPYYNYSNSSKDYESTNSDLNNEGALETDISLIVHKSINNSNNISNLNISANKKEKNLCKNSKRTSGPKSSYPIKDSLKQRKDDLYYKWLNLNNANLDLVNIIPKMKKSYYQAKDIKYESDRKFSHIYQTFVGTNNAIAEEEKCMGELLENMLQIENLNQTVQWNKNDFSEFFSS